MRKYINSTTNASTEEQFNEFKRKKKEEYYKCEQSVCSNASKKDKSVNNVHHIIPIIRKTPTNMIIHIGRNDAPSSTSREIQDKSLKLKSFIKRLIKNLLLKYLLARNFF